MDTIKAAAILRRILQHTDESAAAAEREQRRSAGEGQFSLAWAAQIDMFNRREEEQAIAFVLELLEGSPAYVLKNDPETLGKLEAAVAQLRALPSQPVKLEAALHEATERGLSRGLSPVAINVLEQAEQALLELGAKPDNHCAPGHCRWQRAAVALRNVRGVLGIKS